MQLTIESPIGPLLLLAGPSGLQRLVFLAAERPRLPFRDDGESEAAATHLQEAVRQLREYFGGGRTAFDLPLEMRGSDFQLRAWRAIAAVPFGRTISYSQLAAAAGSPGAFRAAGAACGANPIAIIIPCHRIVGSDGSLHGFGGGLPTKAWLLRHEGVLPLASNREALPRARSGGTAWAAS